MKKGIIVLVVLVVVVIIGFMMYKNVQNSLVDSDENVKREWAQVQNQYQRRADLIPNLVATVKGAAEFEKSTLTEVINARAKATSIQVDPDKLTPEKLREFQQAQGELSQALGRLMVVSESYPDLKSNQNFLALQDQLEGTENRITVARKDYNEVVTDYNKKVRSFPTSMVAGSMGFDVRGTFEADAAAQRAPQVQF